MSDSTKLLVDPTWWLGAQQALILRGYLTSLDKSANKRAKRKWAISSESSSTGISHQDKSEARSGWIAAARLEELAGKIVAARNVIARGCEHCPKSEDAWLENIRLNDNHNARLSQQMPSKPTTTPSDCGSKP